MSSVRGAFLKPIPGESLPVGSGGYVKYLSHLGSDFDICSIARVGSGSKSSHELDDVNLLRYLIRHRHTSPFEFAEVMFELKVPMDLWRQIIRHRTANVQEYSTRYREAVDDMDSIKMDEWRAGDSSIRQGSAADKPLRDPSRPDVQDVDLRHILSAAQHIFHRQARALYEQRLDFGVAREQARRDLPLSTYTISAWKCDLHNLLHFMGLRLDTHAQEETREFAKTMAHYVERLFPITFQAFNDFHPNRGAMLLSRQEVEMLKAWLACGAESPAPHPEFMAHAKAREEAGLEPRNGEWNEFRKKVERLGIHVEQQSLISGS